MKERSELIEWLRGEIVGPSRFLGEPTVITFREGVFSDSDPKRRGPLAWRSAGDEPPEEVLYYDREKPSRKYGVGLLHPVVASHLESGGEDHSAATAAIATDHLGIELDIEDVETESVDITDEDSEDESSSMTSGSDDFDVSSPDVRHPSTLGITFCASFEDGGRILIRLPRKRRFEWQDRESREFALNGCYERGVRRFCDDRGRDQDQPVWRRLPAVPPDCQVAIEASALIHGKRISMQVPRQEGSPIALLVEAFPRKMANGNWLITAVLRNVSTPVENRDVRELVLYQTHFEAVCDSARFEHYPESQRPFGQLDAEEQSLALLYRESATWAIGHGCAAGWDVVPSGTPDMIRADVFPAVELPSVTADIRDRDGNPIQLSMLLLSKLEEGGEGEAWKAIDDLSSRYGEWIEKRLKEAERLPEHFRLVAKRHLDLAIRCRERIEAGIRLLRTKPMARKAFRLANEAMLLQQIATKRLPRRPLGWDPARRRAAPTGTFDPPLKILRDGRQGDRIGNWRAFQIAFLLMSLEGVLDGRSDDREIVDLIWFPTGGGKTEAYMGVLALLLFHERLLMSEKPEPPRDGTNALMRYTLRMLTTQQFQRAAALICAMEVIRRRENTGNTGKIAGNRFSLGLWIGSDGAPNKITEAVAAVRRYRNGDDQGNPLVVTECPWCRSEIGRLEIDMPRGIRKSEWNQLRCSGISESKGEPLLHCPDPDCDFGGEFSESWLPIEVIDERIYRTPPSLVIGTADKFAMIAYRPKAGALFGTRPGPDGAERFCLPPGLIIQDELHLISGPLGTMYALYESVIERLCTYDDGKTVMRPKLIASTATIRGAEGQILSLYDRSDTRLFPSPGLTMGDSFFGTYARYDDEAESLRSGRLYLGIHANDYGSILTAQVRTFSAALFRTAMMPADRRDPWWTLLVFYNSIRELGGAKTLFDSDIRSRMKFIFNREGCSKDDRRNLKIVEELTSRLSQSEIVRMMDDLSRPSEGDFPKSVDACLASNIIEVGVDIDRLSLMGVVGQPKTTAQYIQVSGRVGRRWEDRPGLILMIYNPSKSRDRSHFEQFHSYHRRLYERVEPTTATPFAISAIQRGLPGALLTWARQQSSAGINQINAYEGPVNDMLEVICDRCHDVQSAEDIERSVAELHRIAGEMLRKWHMNPQEWEDFPPKTDGEYLMLWPGQFATRLQRERGVVVASSMRQVDGSAELRITPVE